MYQFTSVYSIKNEWKKKRIVVAEVRINGKTVRNIVNHIFKDSDYVETLQGKICPTQLFSFENARRAQEFINAV